MIFSFHESVVFFVLLTSLYTYVFGAVIHTIYKTKNINKIDKVGSYLYLAAIIGVSWLMTPLNFGFFFMSTGHSSLLIVILWLIFTFLVAFTLILGNMFHRSYLIYREKIEERLRILDSLNKMEDIKNETH